ncbi:MAG: sulfotransferase [Gammaproteobacteria bacterium]
MIFGTGGSGTRVIAKIIKAAGYFIGSNLNPANDSLDIANFCNRRVNEYLTATHWINSILEGKDVRGILTANHQDVVDDFEDCIARHRASLQDDRAAWGWKSPRTFYMLPFLYQRYPGIRIIHLVRDGRDIAYSRNQNQLNNHGMYLLKEVEHAYSTPLKSIIIWDRINRASAIFGESLLEGRYLRVRFEDLWLDADVSVARILEHCGCGTKHTPPLMEVTSAIKQPSSFERWKTHDPSDVAALNGLGQVALRLFGYT